MAFAGKPRKVLFIVENLPCPFDRRVWQEACALRDAGYVVSIICPTGKGYDRKFEILEGIHIFRHTLPLEAKGAAGYILEYSAAIFWQFFIAWRVYFSRGFDVIHACNPPDLIFVVGWFFKFFLGKRFLFDHHDISPELYEAKFARRDFWWRMVVWMERLTFKVADVSIATNESYRRIAVERGGMARERVHVVRSGPMLERLRRGPPVEALKKGRKFLVGYVGVMGRQEGVDYLLLAASYIVHKMGRRDVQFGLVGDGTSLEELRALTIELDIIDYVTFTGRVPDQEMLAMLNTADVCVNPDVANDMNDMSTMNKIMEYMALGKAIVQFDLIEGRVSAQGASLYAERNSAHDLAYKIVALLDDPVAREEMGSFGRRRVETELAWSFEIPKLISAYDQIFDDSFNSEKIESSV